MFCATAQMTAWPLNVGGEPKEPMATIGWLLNHFGAAPGLTAQLDFVGGAVTPTIEGYQRMWGHDHPGTYTAACSIRRYVLTAYVCAREAAHDGVQRSRP